MLLNLSFQKATASYLALLPLGTYSTRLAPATLLGKVLRNTFGGSVAAIRRLTNWRQKLKALAPISLV